MKSVHNFFSSLAVRPTLILSLLLLLLTSCGKNGTNSIVKDVNMKTSLREGEVYVDVSAVFNLGSVYMAGVEVNIVDPHDSTKHYGAFRIQPTLNQKTQIGLSVNLSDAANVPGGLATLPNGAMLPIGGLDGVDILELRVADIQARIYLGLDHNAVFLGFAIPIVEFDQLSGYVGAVNIFPGFSIGGVNGMVGLFTGKESRSSGLGFFLDLSSVISPDVLEGILNGTQLSESEFKMAQGGEKMESHLKFSDSIKASDKKVKKAYQWLQKQKTLKFVK